MKKTAVPTWLTVIAIILFVCGLLLRVFHLASLTVVFIFIGLGLVLRVIARVLNYQNDRSEAQDQD
ncbi:MULTISPECIES: hypothetical protein [Hymenobacteraceae]|uniref:Uncharacterized protein n=1 Tax=Nibribacter koreensis TaxID=1084519 RepID=A0ABP8G0G5_9BACT|nr:hypothetical protein [Rufibacter sp. DG15C]AMM50237.1 hypothetical protein TH61_02275 [Rufibacter sp. DG15C]